MAIQNTGNARNILVGASPLFLTVEDSTVSGYIEDMEAGSANAGTLLRNTKKSLIYRAQVNHQWLP